MKNILFFVVVGILASCTNETPRIAAGIKKSHKIPYALAPDSIYRTSAITAALNKAGSMQKNESRKLFMAGLDLLINKNDAKASIDYFRESIYYYPDEKNYSHLFQAYLRSGDIDQADSVNAALTDRIEYAELSFNSSLILAARQDTSGCLSMLESALFEGFVFKDKVLNEKLFDFVKETETFQSLIMSHFGDDEKMLRALFKMFIRSVPEISLPYEMPVDSAAAFNFDQYINYNYAMFVPGMSDSRFSRDVTNEYMFVGKYKTNRGYAFIYKSYEVLSDTLNPVTTNIVIYDTAGKVLSDREIGCFCSPLTSKGFVINKDLSIDINIFERKWEFDPLEKGYAGNKVISSGLVEKQKLILKPDDKLEEAANAVEVVSN